MNRAATRSVVVVVPFAVPPVLRLAAIAGLAGTAATHLLALEHAFAHQAWLGWAFVACAATAGALAVALAVRPGAGLWVAAAALAAATAGAYLCSRTVGLPGLAGDVGAWSEPWAVEALLSEGLVVAAALLAVPARDRANVPSPA